MPAPMSPRRVMRTIPVLSRVEADRALTAGGPTEASGIMRKRRSPTAKGAKAAPRND